MHTPNEDPQRERASDTQDERSARSHIGSILWIMVLVALIALGIWWYSQHTEVLVPQPPAPIQQPMTTGGPAATPEAPEASGGSAVDQPADQSAPLPKATPVPGTAAAVPRDRGPTPLPSNRQPEYPGRALRSGIEGSVSVLIEIDARGVPTDVRVVSRSGERSRDLDRAVVSAARDWRFDPAMRDGRPVPGQVILPVDFHRN